MHAASETVSAMKGLEPAGQTRGLLCGQFGLILAMHAADESVSAMRGLEPAGHTRGFVTLLIDIDTCHACCQ